MVFLEDGRTSWDLDSAVRIIMPHPVLGKLAGLGLPHVDMVRKIYVCLMKDVNCDDF